MRGRHGFLSRSIAGVAFVTFGGVLWAPALAAGLPRVASMNVCTDQLLITLADPQQIVGLSRFSWDGWQSSAGDGRRFPVLSGGAEDLLVLKPDIIIASLFDKRSTRELLKDNGLRLAEFPVPRNLDEVKDQIRAMGKIVQHPDRAEAEIAQLDASVARELETGEFESVDRMEPERFRAVVETNLFGPYYAIHAAAPLMKRNGGGFVVNIASLASVNAFAGGAAYNASKFGLNGMSEALMQEVRYDGIKVS